MVWNHIVMMKRSTWLISHQYQGQMMKKVFVRWRQWLCEDIKLHTDNTNNHNDVIFDVEFVHFGHALHVYLSPFPTFKNDTVCLNIQHLSSSNNLYIMIDWLIHSFIHSCRHDCTLLRVNCQLLHRYTKYILDAA